MLPITPFPATKYSPRPVLLSYPDDCEMKKRKIYSPCIDSVIHRSRLTLTYMKTALITGITGQDGAYLAELLLEKGYMVHGIKRRSSLFNTERIDHLYQDPHERNIRMKLHYGDLTDSTNLIRIIQEVQPDEI